MLTILHLNQLFLRLYPQMALVLVSHRALFGWVFEYLRSAAIFDTPFIFYSALRGVTDSQSGARTVPRDLPVARDSMRGAWSLASSLESHW